MACLVLDGNGLVVDVFSGICDGSIILKQGCKKMELSTKLQVSRVIAT